MIQQVLPQTEHLINMNFVIRWLPEGDTKGKLIGAGKLEKQLEEGDYGKIDARIVAKKLFNDALTIKTDKPAFKLRRGVKVVISPK